MNKYILAIIAIISVATHYSGISPTIPIIVMGLVLMGVYIFSEKVTTVDNDKSKAILLALTTIYVVSGIIFMLDWEQSQKILEFGALIILFAALVIGTIWFFSDKPESIKMFKNLSKQAYMIGCLDIGFALLNHWHC